MKSFLIRKIASLASHLQSDAPDGKVDMSRTIPTTAFIAFRNVSRYFHTEIIGEENLPSTGVMVVGNHALAGIDSLALFPELYAVTGRVPRGLGLRPLFETPILRDILEQCGAVCGDRENAIRLLQNDEMVVVYPGGARDSLKARDERYTLRWGNRTGFAHCALEAQRPVSPIAAIGPDEVFPVIADRGIRMKWLNDESVPVFLPIMRRVPFTFLIGEPIEPPKATGTERADERRARAFAKKVQTGLEDLIDQGLHLRDSA